MMSRRPLDAPTVDEEVIGGVPTTGCTCGRHAVFGLGHGNVAVALQHEYCSTGGVVALEEGQSR